jgi:predicted DCC family thiol-disulfide oxidoreductase YuxK
MFLWLSSLTMTSDRLQTSSSMDFAGHYFGSVFVVDIYPLFAILCLLAATASLLLATGYKSRATAIFLTTCLSAFLSTGIIAFSNDVAASFLLLVIIIFTPGESLLSISGAQLSIDELESWTLPVGLWEAIWILFCALLFSFGLSYLFSFTPGVYVFGNELNPLFDRRANPTIGWAYLIACLQLLCSILPIRDSVYGIKSKFISWLIVLTLLTVLQLCTFFLLIDDFQLSIAFSILFLFLFDPNWIPQSHRDRAENVFYDGECGLCHGFVRLLLLEDKNEQFLLSPLQGEHIKTCVESADREMLPDSIVVQTLKGELLIKSDAAIYLFHRLGGAWRPLAILVSLVPKIFRDFAYDCVARIRHRVFKEPEAACPLLPPQLQDRFMH